MRELSLLATCFVVALTTAGDVLAQGSKCKFLQIVDWPVRMVRNHLVVDGAVNGRKIGIMLDTGAHRSLVLRTSAERLELPRRDAKGYRMFGFGGETKVEIASVENFKLGEVSIKEMQFLVAGETNFGVDVDVLLGEDFLRRFDIEFDLAHNAVRLFQTRDCEGVSLAYWTKEVPGEVEIEAVDENRPRINLMVQVNGKPIEAFLDSGASTSVLSMEHAASLGVTPDTPGVTRGYVGSGLGAKAVDSWSGPFKSFAIGNERMEDVRIRFADVYGALTYSATGSRIPQKVSKAQPMLLGADFLRSHRTLVAHSQRRLYFTYIGGPVFFAEPPPPAPASPPDGKANSTAVGN